MWGALLAAMLWLQWGAVADVIFVDHSAQGAQNGGSWQDALLTIESAMDEAESGDQIWVADGTYDESVEFLPGVALYGGFAGGESAVEERDWGANETIIKYIKCADDMVLDGVALSLPNSVGIVISQNQNVTLENCLVSGYRRYGISGSQSQVAIKNCVITNTQDTWGISLSGSTVSMTNTKIVGNLRCGVMLNDCESMLYECRIADNGFPLESSWRDSNAIGGLYAVGGKLIFEAGVIENNFSRSEKGGGISARSVTDLRLKDAVIRRNCGYEFGGGIYLYQSSLLAENSAIQENVSQQGGAVYADESVGVFNDVVFACNMAVQAGGVVCTEDDQSSLQFTHCTIYANQSLAGSVFEATHVSPVLQQCIIWGNINAHFKLGEANSVVATYCCIEGESVWPGDGNMNANPLLKGWGDAHDFYVDAGFADEGTGALDAPFKTIAEALNRHSVAICEGSPCIGAGPAGEDLGVRFPAVPGPPGGDMTLHVAAGLYTTPTFSLVHNTSIEGAGAEETILNSTVFGLVEGHYMKALSVRSAQIAGIVTFAGGDIEDCSVTENHVSSAWWMNNDGYAFGAVACLGGETRIRGCTIDDNGWAGVFVKEARLEVEDSILGKPGYFGRALQAQDAEVSIRRSMLQRTSVTGGTCTLDDCETSHSLYGLTFIRVDSVNIINSRFLDNVCGSYIVGCIECPRVTLHNCIFSGNTGTMVEGVFSCTKSLCTLRHVTFVRNDRPIYIEACLPTFINCIAWDNFGQNFIVQDGGVTVRYSCIQGDAVHPGEGNINEAPGFLGFGLEGDIYLDPEAPASGDGSQENPYHGLHEVFDRYSVALTEASPCVGQGEGGANMGALFEVVPGTVPDTYTLHLSEGIYGEFNALVGNNIVLAGEGVDRTFLEGPLRRLGSGSRLSHLTIRDVADRHGLSVIGSPVVEHCRIVGCHGGILCREYAAPMIEGVEILDNTRNGIYCQANSAPTVSEAIIAGNKTDDLHGVGSSEHGGGIFCESPTSLTCRDVQVLGNEAEYGGGIYLRENCTAALTRVTIDACNRNGLSAHNAELIVEDCSIINNLEYGFRLDNLCQVEMHNCLFSGNAGTAIYGGGNSVLNGSNVDIVNNYNEGLISSGIYWVGGEIVLSHALISKNRITNNNGAALSLYGGCRAELSYTEISKNTANHGYAVEIYGSQLIGDHCFIRGNTVAGVWFSSDNGIMHNCVVVDNVGHGIAIGSMMSTGSAEITQCTVSGNTHSGIWNNKGYFTLTDAIVWGNLGDKQLDSHESRVIASHSCIGGEDTWEGWGNINSDPKLVGWGEMTADVIHVDASHPLPGDGSAQSPFPSLHDGLFSYSYQLTEGSPCIGEGESGDNMGAALGVSTVESDYSKKSMQVASGLYEAKGINLVNVASFQGAGMEKTIVKGMFSGLTEGAYVGHLEISDNVAHGMLIQNVDNFRLSHLKFRHNQGRDGVAILCEASSGLISDCRFEEHFVGDSFNDTGSVVMIEQESDEAPGVALERCTFENNAAFQGTILISPDRVSDSAFLNNFTTGSSICLFYRPVLIEGCRFLGNASGRFNGMLHCSKPKIVNSLFVGNKYVAINLPWGHDPSPRVANCIFYQNSSADYPAMTGGRPGDNIVSNSILWREENLDPNITLVSCLTDTDPIFVQAPEVDFERYKSITINGTAREFPDFIVTPGDFHLRAGSPAIDAGSVEMAAERDVDGKLRECGQAPDIGIYEICENRNLFVRGDVNGDGRTNLADPIALLDYLYVDAAAPGCLDAADANNDGRLQLSDPIYILSFLFNNGQPFVSPHPECGRDTERDALDCKRFDPCKE